MALHGEFDRLSDESCSMITAQEEHLAQMYKREVLEEIEREKQAK